MSQTIYMTPEKIYGGREEVKLRISAILKLNPDAKILDIGAAWNPLEEATHTFDFNEFQSKSVHKFTGNINDYEDWIQIFDYVDQFGKFDFCNCTHTLEDLAYPQAALKYMPRIAKEGFVAVPSKYYELQRRELYRGATHHRWIFSGKDNVLVGYPKLNLIDYVNYQPSSKIEHYGNTELRIMWSDTIDWTIINNDYMGPSKEAIDQMFLDLFYGSEI